VLIIILTHLPSHKHLQRKLLQQLTSSGFGLDTVSAISFSEPAVAPSLTALPAAPALSKPLAAASASAAVPKVPTEPAAPTATPVTTSAAAQLALPASALIPANTITSSLKFNSTAAASLSPSNVTAAAQNLTQDGMMYNLKGIASNGSFLTPYDTEPQLDLLGISTTGNDQRSLLRNSDALWPACKLCLNKRHAYAFHLIESLAFLSEQLYRQTHVSLGASVLLAAFSLNRLDCHCQIKLHVQVSFSPAKHRG